MDRGAWWPAVHGVAKSQTRLSDFTFTFHFHALEKEMATHSSVLAWRIPGSGEPPGLLSMGSHRVGHDWSDLAAAAAARLKKAEGDWSTGRNVTKNISGDLNYIYNGTKIWNKEAKEHILGNEVGWYIERVGNLQGLKMEKHEGKDQLKVL